jgi:hypothetical protein
VGKSPLASRGVVFGVVAAAASVAAAFGVSVDVGAVVEITLMVGAAASGLYAAWGRYTATQPIRRKA